MKKIKLFLTSIIIEAIEKATPKKDILETLIKNVSYETNIKFEGLGNAVNYFIVDGRNMSKAKFHDRLEYFHFNVNNNGWTELCSASLTNTNGDIYVYSYFKPEEVDDVELSNEKLT